MVSVCFVHFQISVLLSLSHFSITVYLLRNRDCLDHSVSLHVSIYYSLPTDVVAKQVVVFSAFPDRHQLSSGARSKSDWIRLARPLLALNFSTGRKYFLAFALSLFFN